MDESSPEQGSNGGKGAAATVNGQAVLIGNRRLLADESVSLSPAVITQAEQLLKLLCG